MQRLGAEMAGFSGAAGSIPELGLFQVSCFPREERGRYNLRANSFGKLNCEGDEYGRLRKAVGTRGIDIWVVPAVTGCRQGSRAREIAGWAGYHRSHAKSRLDSTAATLPRHAGFSWR